MHAVSGVDVEIAPGESVALLGADGAGKSTTIDMLLGLRRPDSGSATLFGLHPAEAVARGAVGAMRHGDGALSRTTVRRLLRVMGTFHHHPLPVDEILRITGLTGVAATRTHRLSVAQTQHLRAAVALISNPDLLVLDEPTRVMGAEDRHAFWASIRPYSLSGRTVVFATHDLGEAGRYADRIVLMSRGVVLADGPAEEISAAISAPAGDLARSGLECSDLARGARAA